MGNRLKKSVVHGFVLFLALILSTLAASPSKAAYLVTGPDAELTWTGTLRPVLANVVVTRFEEIGLYRYNPDATESFVVWSGHFADSDSLSGNTPKITAPQPAPWDNVDIPVSDAIPLEPSQDFTSDKPIFIVLNNPLLESEAFGIHPDGLPFISVTLEIEDESGNMIYNIITLVRENDNSDNYVGYLHPAKMEITEISRISIIYDDYGEIPDSATFGTPSFVDRLVIDYFNARKVGQITPVIDLPDTGLFLSKEAQRSNVTTGDFLSYRMRLENISGVSVRNTEIKDHLPKGFRYQRGSLRINGIKIDDPQIEKTGRMMTIPVGDMAPEEAVEIRYVLEVTIGAPVGAAINTAFANAKSLFSPLISNEAKARTIVEHPFFNDTAFLMGRVIAGECGDSQGSGVEGVRLYLEDGTNVITDKHGRWHIEGVRPGTHVLQIDTDTLSPRHTLRFCHDTSRSAGNAASRFVNVQGGTLWREDFYLKELPEVPDQLQQQLRTSSLESKQGYGVELDLATGDTRFQEIISEIYLPEGFYAVSGKTSLDGQPIDDLHFQDDHYRLRLSPDGVYWRHRLALQVYPAIEADLHAEKTVRVITYGQTESGEQLHLQSKNVIAVAPPQIEHRTIVLRPHFEILSADLRASDLDALESAVEEFKAFTDYQITINGHTDSLPVRFREGREINDNYTLGYARARAVANHLNKRLEIDLKDIIIHSAGADEPIADNATEEGRALNRRVEIDATLSRRITGPEYSVVKGDSGLSRASEEQPLENRLPDEFRGMVNITDQMSVAQPVISVNTVLDSQLKPRLLLNGKEIPTNRIGMQMTDPTTGATRYVWVGIQLFNEGENEIEIQGLDTFGNVRFSEAKTIILTGQIKLIRFAGHHENVADGRSPIGVRLLLTDERGRPINTRMDLQLVQSGGLRPLHTRKNENPLDLKDDIVAVDNRGYAWFEPVSNAGNYRIRLAAGDVISEEIEVVVDPYLRDWILVGFAEGSVGYNHLKNNQSELDDADKDFYTDGDMAFFARGRVKGEWLLTASYDSRRRQGDAPLGQRIDPNAWYVLYGDDTYRRHDAPTSDRLYVRMERRDFYVLYGDFDTGLTVTELSRYSRVLTGAKAEYRGRNISATGFASETWQGYIRDQIPGDGTSGLYQLSMKNIIPGSERVTIEVRDRFTAELIAEQGQTRFIDYSIDYVSGTIFFRRPVSVQDEGFNPIYIIIEFENDRADRGIVSGGRVAVHDSERHLEVGVSGLYDDTFGAGGSLGGIDATWKPNDNHTLRAERAQSRHEVGPDQFTDNAWLAEHRYVSERLDTRAHVREQRSGFGLGQQSPTQDARRIIGGDARYRLTDSLSVAGELSRQEVLDTDGRRDLIETRATYDRLDWGIFGGLRHAEDHRSGNVFRSDQIVAGAHRHLMENRLRVGVRGEANINETNENTDYPSRLGLGADYRVTSWVNLFSAQEFSWNDERRTSDTRAGLRTNPWKGGTVSTEVRQTQDEYGPRLFAHSGLYQTLELGSGWSTDFGLDRAHTVRDKDAREESFDPERPSASGTRAGDYTAVFTGLGYRTAAWQATGRVEHRDSDIDNKWNFLSGFHYRVNDADTLAGRILHFYSRAQNGERREESTLEGSFVHRPLASDWFVLNRTRFIMDAIENQSDRLKGTRWTNNTVVNFHSVYKHQLSFQYGARYVVDTIDEDRYRGYTDLIGYEYRYDILPRWDIGTRGSHLTSWNSGVRKSSFGVMAGFSPIKDVWLSLGYNFLGFYDDDFDGASGRIQGVVLDFRIKFDHHSLGHLKKAME